MCSSIITVAANQGNGVRDVVWLVEFASHCQSSGFQLPGLTQAAVVDACNPNTWRRRQKDRGPKVTLGYTVSLR